MWSLDERGLRSILFVWVWLKKVSLSLANIGVVVAANMFGVMFTRDICVCYVIGV